MTSDWSATVVKIWDVSPTGGAEWGNVASIPAVGAPGFVDRDDAVLAASSDDYTASIWNIATGEEQRRIGAVAPPDADGLRFEVSRMPATSRWLRGDGCRSTCGMYEPISTCSQ